MDFNQLRQMNNNQLRQLIQELTTWRPLLEQALDLAELDNSVPGFILDLQTALEVIEGSNNADDS